MKDISKVSKQFSCDCGTVNKFEFETDFDIHNISISAKCQNCGKENIVSLENFFRKTNDTSTNTAMAMDTGIPVMNFSEVMPTNTNVNEIIETEVKEQLNEQPVQEQNINEITIESEEEDLTSEEKEAFSDLFGKL